MLKFLLSKLARNLLLHCAVPTAAPLRGAAAGQGGQARAAGVEARCVQQRRRRLAEEAAAVAARMHRGSEFSSLEGSWVLDRSRSDAMQPHLLCLNVADLAIEAQAKCEADSESRNVISINGAQFAIHKRTKINALTEHFTLGTERSMPARSGTRRTTVTLRTPGDPSAIEVTTVMPIATGSLHLVETRTLMDKGHTCLQELRLTNVTTGGKCVTRRVWVRVPTTHADREALEQETPPLTQANCMPGPMPPSTVP